MYLICIRQGLDIFFLGRIMMMLTLQKSHYVIQLCNRISDLGDSCKTLQSAKKHIEEILNVNCLLWNTWSFTKNQTFGIQTKQGNIFACFFFYQLRTADKMLKSVKSNKKPMKDILFLLAAVYGFCCSMLKGRLFRKKDGFQKPLKSIIFNPMF